MLRPGAPNAHRAARQIKAPVPRGATTQLSHALKQARRHHVQQSGTGRAEDGGISQGGP